MSEPITSHEEFRKKKPEVVAEFARMEAEGFERLAKLYAAYKWHKIDASFDDLNDYLKAHYVWMFRNVLFFGRCFMPDDYAVLEGFTKTCCKPCKALAKLLLDLHKDNPKFGDKEWKDKILEMDRTGELDKYLSIPNEEIDKERQKEKEEKEKAEKREPLTEEQTLKALHLGKYCILVPYTTGVCYRDLFRTADTKEGLERLMTRDERRFGHTYWCETTCDKYPILQEKR
jgi:thiol-disulfide isomerase/thioredoxin